MAFNRRIYVVLTFLGLMGISNAQQVFPHSTLLDYTVPSPNAASLGKFGDIPVNYNVGLPSITVPIFSYSKPNDALALNISLDYFGGGIRVQEKSSNVGIGWSLNAGGVITRQMRGGPDEGGMGYTGYWAGPALPDVADYQLDENMYGTTVTPTNPYYRYNAGMEDSEPDVFSFNFGGKSGKFIIGKNGDVLIYPSQQLKITKLPGSPTFGFTIVTEEGVKYIFDQQENSGTYVGNVKYYNASAWYVSKIVAPFSTEEINFSYESYISYYQRLFSQTAYKNMMGGSSGGLSGLQSYGNFMSFEAKRLTSISFPRGITLNFSYSTVDRCDVIGDKALKEILITDGQNIRGFRLNSNYSFSSSAPPPSNCTGYNEETTRLVLHDVTEFSGNVEKAPYVFEYNSSVSLPGTNSYAVDHWGFYNGATSNSTLLPYNGTGMGTPPSGALDNANRDANPAYAQAGIIKKIQYPTGGYTEFEFESNTVPATGGSQTVNQNMTASINGMLPDKSTTFTLEKPGTSASPTDFHFEFGGFSSANANCRIIASIVSLDGATTYTDVTLGPGVGYSKTVSVSIPPGTYKYKYAFELPTSPCVTELFVVALDWINIITVPANTPWPVGGLRIKSIKEFDGVSSNALKSRSYSYTIENSEVSSGVLAVKPYYTYNYNDECTGGIDCSNEEAAQCAAQTGAYFVIFSSPLFTLSSAFGNTVLYSRVVENFTGDGTQNNGSIIRTYTTTATMPEHGFPFDAFNPSFMTAPFITPQSLDWIYGALLSEKVYDNNAALKKSIENTYALKADALPSNIKNNFKGIKVFKRRSVWVGCTGSALQTINFQLNEYFPVIGTTQLISSVENEYKDNSIVNTIVKAYEYDPNYFTVSKIATSDSKGKIIDQRFYYPFSYTGNAAFTALTNTHHILSPLVSTEIWQEQPGDASSRKLVAGQVSEYATFNGSIIKPATMYDFQAFGPVAESTIGVFNPSQVVRNSTYYHPAVQFTAYNNNAYVVEQKKYQDVPMSYIWGSKGSGPIAEATNALSSEIYFESFEEQPGWSTGWLSYDQSKAHAGSWSAKLTASTGSPAYNLSPKWLNVSHTAPRKYRYSGWVYSDGPSSSIYLFMKTAAETGYYTYLDNIGTTETNKWVYLEKEFSVPANITLLNLRIDNSGGGNVWFDDLRLHPSDARMVTYTYNPLAGITSRADANNRFTFFEHDNLGRLVLTRDHDNNILQKFCYTYTGQTEECSFGTAPDWRNTSTALRCKTLDGVRTGEQEQEQKDMNPYSQSTGTTRWVVVGQNCSVCAKPATWEATGITRCELDGNGNNTGYREMKFINRESCSANYLAEKWEVYTQDLTNCPPPPPQCNEGNCSGNDKKCIAGVCETGVWTCVSATRLGPTVWRVTYRYKFSDGSYSTYYQEIDQSSMCVGGDPIEP